ncbi:hypothetical protein BST81_01020 [Leptolyngbya sp. 'hensonii']|uniref:AbiU2 domain-containing protein n=1 Tax=Leptolyngbya sp. 'hensonii' TaxID=1922337 RepID=UPI00094FE6EE|nr:hypothetical protein [Leptolyngbya sp. 'hensonii']OLP20347.1 hypothetical protein BST81_01020 [Leptolyngbya sp. 'hensonii']
MKINVKTGDELNRLLDNLQQEIVYANIYYRLYWDLNDALRSHPEEFAQSNTFWVLTFDALQDAWLIRLCRVFDTQCNNNLNLVNLLETIKENLHFFNEQNFRERLKDNAFVNSLAECDRVPDQAQLDKDIEFAKADPLVEKLRIWRNNIVAHKGSKFVLGKAPQLSEDPLECIPLL